MRGFTIYICEDCLELKGEMCCTPECVFCFMTMDEVEEILDTLKIKIKCLDGMIAQKGVKIK